MTTLNIAGSNLSSDRLKRPFWVGQVTATYPNQGKLRVHWLLPPTTHTGRVGKGTKGNVGNGEEPVALNDESTVNRPAGDKLSYVTPLHPPKERKHMPQEPNKHCVLRHYPYAQFKAVMDLNSSTKSSSNKGVRKPIVPSFVIPFDCVYFSFAHLTPDSRLPHNVLDEISNEAEIEWKG